MELKKAIKCIDNTYVEGTSDMLASMAYRYDADFSDDNLREIAEFATAMQDKRSANIMEWMLESRKEIANGQLNLGQIKIDFLTGNYTSPIRYGKSEVEIVKEGEKVLLIITMDGGAYYHTGNVYDLSEIMEAKPGDLERFIGETLYYASPVA